MICLAVVLLNVMVTFVIAGEPMNLVPETKRNIKAVFSLLLEV